MSALRVVTTAVLVAVIFLATQAIAGALVPLRAAAASPAAAWWMLSTSIGAATLALVAMRSSWSGWHRAAAVALIPLVIQLANLVEAALFLKNAPVAIGRLMLWAVVAYVLAIPALVPVFRSASVPASAHAGHGMRPAGGALWRFAACDLGYLFLYYLAGTIIITLPQVRAFYQAQGVPPALQVVGMQLLVRGPVFVGLCILLTGMLRLPRPGAAVAVGLAFAVLSGVVPLLPPNPFFPDAVRWAHFGEVVSSNFVFGSLVGWLWTRPLAVGEAHGASLPSPQPV